VKAGGMMATVNMKATSFSETSVDFQRTTQRYTPEDRTFSSSFVCRASLPSSTLQFVLLAAFEFDIQIFFPNITFPYFDNVLTFGPYNECCYSDSLMFSVRL
jgi:hypothetical protein